MIKPLLVIGILWGLRRGAIILAFALGLVEARVLRSRATVDDPAGTWAGPAFDPPPRGPWEEAWAPVRWEPARWEPALGVKPAGRGRGWTARRSYSCPPSGTARARVRDGSVVRLLLNVWLMFMVHQLLFGGGRRSAYGGDAAY